MNRRKFIAGAIATVGTAMIPLPKSTAAPTGEWYFVPPQRMGDQDFTIEFWLRIGDHVRVTSMDGEPLMTVTDITTGGLKSIEHFDTPDEFMLDFKVPHMEWKNVTVKKCSQIKVQTFDEDDNKNYQLMTAPTQYMDDNTMKFFSDGTMA